MRAERRPKVACALHALRKTHLQDGVLVVQVGQLRHPRLLQRDHLKGKEAE